MLSRRETEKLRVSQSKDLAAQNGQLEQMDAELKVLESKLQRTPANDPALDDLFLEYDKLKAQRNQIQAQREKSKKKPGA